MHQFLLRGAVLLTFRILNLCIQLLLFIPPPSFFRFLFCVPLPPHPPFFQPVLLIIYLKEFELALFVKCFVLSPHFSCVVHRHTELKQWGG